MQQQNACVRPNPSHLGRRVEVLWNHGDPGAWYPVTVLDGGRVKFDNHFPFVPDPPFILEPEEIADWRPR